MPRIEEVGAVLQLRLLLLELRQLGLPLMKSAMIAAPGEYAVRARDRMAGEGADDDQRQRGKRRAADQLEDALGLPSCIFKESRRNPERKRKE